MQTKVVDETNLTDRYDFVLEWDSSMPSAMVDALRGLGLRLTPGMRAIPVLFVRSDTPVSPAPEPPDSDAEKP